MRDFTSSKLDVLVFLWPLRLKKFRIGNLGSVLSWDLSLRSLEERVWVTDAGGNRVSSSSISRLSSTDKEYRGLGYKGILPKRGRSWAHW